MQELLAPLALAMAEARDKVTVCSHCGNVDTVDPCTLCTDPRRDRTLICVVEEPSDVLALERTNEFRGLYHVLGGSLSPLDGVGPEELKVRELLGRVNEGVSEVILAINPDVEGEATILYLTRLLKPAGVRVSRIARGIPVGGDLEFADEATISRALEGRIAL